MERRLAAIMAADVVGYGRLMEQDEAGTLAALKARRKQVLEPLVAKYHGRVFKVTGDGVLVEFASAVNAVQCAVDVQHAMAAANGDLPEDHRIVLRIGINLGDVMVEGSDLYGDGVNIAARLEGIAEPGAILISATAYDYVKNKVSVGFHELGAQNLKNIAEPVRCYRVGDTPHVSAAVAKVSTEKPSIAVLPFVNMSGDPTQQYFSDGVTEDIITELSRFHQISVVARNSAFQYRDKAVDVKQVGRELGVQYVVEGSVRKVGHRIRITVQLIDSASGNHLWAERFDRDEQEIFAVQDQVVRTIVGTLVGRLEAAGAEQANRKPPANLAAYEYVLQGNALPWGEPQTEAKRRRMYEMAIELDPGYARAHALLSHAIYLEWFRGVAGSEAALDRALELGRKAVALDENDSACHSHLAWIHLNRRSFDLAEQHFRHAIELNPNNPNPLHGMGFLLIFSGKPDEGIPWLTEVKRLDPYFDSARHWRTLGLAHFVARRYDEAIAAFSRSSTIPVWVQAYLAACYAMIEQNDRAKECTAEVARQEPNFSATRLAAKEPYRHAADREHLLQGLHKAELPE
jgi:TolB-like protein